MPKPGILRKIKKKLKRKKLKNEYRSKVGKPKQAELNKKERELQKKIKEVNTKHKNKKNVVVDFGAGIKGKVSKKEYRKKLKKDIKNIKRKKEYNKSRINRFVLDRFHKKVVKNIFSSKRKYNNFIKERTNFYIKKMNIKAFKLKKKYIKRCTKLMRKMTIEALINSIKNKKIKSTAFKKPISKKNKLEIKKLMDSLIKENLNMLSKKESEYISKYKPEIF